MKANISVILFLCILMSSCAPEPISRNSKKRVHETNINPSKDKNTIQSSKEKDKLISEKIFSKCNPAVFTITADNWAYRSQGSGFFINSSGLAVSNYHVFENMDLSTAIVYLASGEQYPISEVVAYNQEQDIIVFYVAIGSGKVHSLKMTTRKPVIGSKVYAIGSPKGLTNTFSSGEISQLRGDNLIQINVPIDHGSSGGALINEYGEVIGITSAGIDDSGANLNFAIDISVVKKYLPEQ